jgi:hypothetical protein
MDALIPGTHDPKLPHGPDADRPADHTEGRRAYAPPALEVYGSVPAITAGSNIFGDDLQTQTPL